jgi:hypothetical protein
MPFACCGSCGNVTALPRGLPQYGRPVGACPDCGRTMYWTATPFADRLLRMRESTRRQLRRQAAQAEAAQPRSFGPNL